MNTNAKLDQVSTINTNAKLDQVNTINTNAKLDQITTNRAEAFAPGTFVALEVSYQLIAALRGLMPMIRKSDRDLADQIQRAATSVCLNIAEGQKSMKGNRLKHYSIAHGSANEVKAGLFVAKAWGWIDGSERALAVLDRLLGLLWGLTRR
jgi:four helix bundle protein